MICSRAALLEKLRLLKPVVATVPIAPASTHFLFDGTRIVATNGYHCPGDLWIAASVPHLGNLTALLPAKILLRLLGAATARAVQIESDGKDAIVTVGGARIGLPSLPVEQWRFEMPTEMPRHALPVAFLYGIRHCLRQISTYYTTYPGERGVTVLADGRDIRLFSTNRSTISTARVRIPGFKLQERVILPADFCALMLRFAAKARTWRFDILRDGYALFAADDALLCGELLADNNPCQPPLNFVGTVARHLPRDYRSQSIPIPKALHSVVKRCARITAVHGLETKTAIIVRDGVATFMTKSDYGAISDQVPLPNHPDVKLQINARLLASGLTWAERFLIRPDCVVMSRGEHFLLCAAFED